MPLDRLSPGFYNKDVMKKLSNQNCTDFTRALASTEPVPGGGGAAALCGALAASLCAMAGGITAGRKKYAERAEALKPVVRRCEELRLELLALIDLDAEGFLPLSRAYSLPKDAPGREQALSEASLAACAAPLAMLEACGETAELLEQAEKLCSPLLLSDVGCGAALCRAAMECAAMNVFVNTGGRKDEPRARELSRHASELLGLWLPRMDDLAARVRTGLEEGWQNS